MKLRLAKKIIATAVAGTRRRASTWQRSMRRWDKYNSDPFWTVDFLTRLSNGKISFMPLKDFRDELAARVAAADEAETK